MPDPATTEAGWPVVVTSDSAAATRELAACLAPLCAGGDILLLIGDLGAGKTVFAQGFATGLGVSGPVTSPTFALVRQYACASGGAIDILIHADVYRTGSLREVDDLALAELVEERAVALIEWGDLAAPVMGESVLEVTIAAAQPAVEPGSESVALGVPGDPDQRVLSLHGWGEWAGRADEVAQAISTRTPVEAP